jgi:hypothetical protein
MTKKESTAEQTDAALTTTGNNSNKIASLLEAMSNMGRVCMNLIYAQV